MAGGLDLVDQGGIDKAAAAQARGEGAGDEATEERRGRHLASGVAVEARELAVGVEAGQRRVGGEEGASALVGRSRGVVAAVFAGDADGAATAEAGKGLDRVVHDWLLTSGSSNFAAAGSAPV